MVGHGDLGIAQTLDRESLAADLDLDPGKIFANRFALTGLPRAFDELDDLDRELVTGRSQRQAECGRALALSVSGENQEQSAPSGFGLSAFHPVFFFQTTTSAGAGSGGWWRAVRWSKSARAHPRGSLFPWTRGRVPGSRRLLSPTTFPCPLAKVPWRSTVQH